MHSISPPFDDKKVSNFMLTLRVVLVPLVKHNHVSTACSFVDRLLYSEQIYFPTKIKYISVYYCVHFCVHFCVNKRSKSLSVFTMYRKNNVSNLANVLIMYSVYTIHIYYIAVLCISKCIVCIYIAV